jgi:hypothetical protein
MDKRRLSRPIDRLRQRAALSALKAAVLQDKLAAAKAAARRDQLAVDAAEARRAERAAARTFYFEGGASR